MRHLVWGVLVLAFLGSLIYFPGPATFVALFFGAYKISEVSDKIGRWAENKYRSE